MSNNSKYSASRRILHQTPAFAESDEDSPEPSPVMPPDPQLQYSQQMPSPFTPGANERFPACDDETIPSIPDDVPSPYSPPPASLFSGEAFPPKSVRKPLAEVHISTAGRSKSSTSLHSSRNQNQQHSTYMGESPRDPNNTSHIIPTVQIMKKEMQDKEHELFLLKQENNLLTESCERFQKENQVLQQTAKESATEKGKVQQEYEEHIKILQEQHDHKIKELQASHEKEVAAANAEKETNLKNACDQLAKATNEVAELRASVSRIEKDKKRAERELDTARNELSEMKSKHKEQALSSAKKTRSIQDDCSKQVESLRSKNQSYQLEIDRLKAELIEAKKYATKNEKSQAEIEQLQSDLEECNTQLETLRDENETLVSEFAEKEIGMQEEIDRLDNELQSMVAASAENLTSANVKSQAKIKELQEALADSTEREENLLADISALGSKLTSMEQKMREENETSQEAIERLNISINKKREALKEYRNKYEKVCGENESLRTELRRYKKIAQTPNIQRVSDVSQKDLKGEVARLQGELADAHSKCDELQSECDNLTKRLSQSNRDHSRKSTYDNVDDDAIPDRLVRIRDAADRAALVQEHRRELLRLKEEYSDEIKKLTERHEKDLEDVTEEAKSEASLKAREVRRRLQKVHDEKIASLQRRHQDDLSRVQRECDENTAAVEEAMQSLEEELHDSNQKYDELLKVRENLEMKVRDLESKLSIEAKKGSDWATTRKKLKEEKYNMLTSIQEEFNSIVAQKMANGSLCSLSILSNDSPRSIIHLEDERDLSNIGSEHDLSMSTDIKENKSRLNRSVLEETEATEAIVRGLLGK